MNSNRKSPSNGGKRTNMHEETASKFSGAAAVTPMGVDTATMGVSNVTRRFKLDPDSIFYTPSAYNTPSYFLNFIKPLEAFVNGWDYDQSGDIDSHKGDALDRTIDNVEEELFPRTEYTKHWLENVWPLMDNIFQSGVGARTRVSMSQVVKYYANILYIYTLSYQALSFKYMAYNYDWSQITPFTSSVPPSLYQLVRDYQCTDVEIADLWLPLLQRIEMLAVPPDLISEVKQMMVPFHLSNSAMKPIIPVAWWGYDPWDWTDGDQTNSKLNPITEIKEVLDFIDVGLEDTSNLMRSFLPFPLNMQSPWALGAVSVDPLRSNALHNMSLRPTTAFGTSSVDDYPSADEGLRWQLTNGDWSNIHYHSPIPGAMWGELKSAFAFAVEGNTQGFIKYSLLTPHGYGGLAALADDYDKTKNSTFLLSTVADSFSDDAARYYKVFPTERWQGADNYNISGGFLIPGTIVTEVPYEAAARILRLEVESDWNYNILRAMTTRNMGASMREVRETFHQMFYQTVKRNVG